MKKVLSVMLLLAVAFSAKAENKPSPGGDIPDIVYVVTECGTRYAVPARLTAAQIAAIIDMYTAADCGISYN